ncbi:nesprin-1 [Trichonephila inaurata madagascariensis]|uniref:Nesprin-1 n=1 Tax=Trichonephila inaurata madagascariensis TaxID=2747483 RepID=A0A8X7BS93_9ARAC|nr:nesprin-1 [Trichonephila inaurata madagascariensis]
MMYNAMCTKSEGLLGKLKDSISDHQKYIDNCRKFQEFMSTCHIKLQECKDTSGEKAVIVSRLNILKELMSKQSEGDKMLSDLEKLCTVVCKNTSEHGCEILRHEMKELSDSWSQYNTALTESKCNLTNVIQQWSSFEKNMNALNKWFKNIDAEFKKPQLQSSLKEKEEQFDIIKDLNEKVICYQKDLDTLTDEAHSLTHASGVESIKFDVSQLNVRYQNLLSLSKTLLHRWEVIVQDHRAFEKKADEFCEWLSSAGRESIRERLRELRDKFDLFSNNVLEVQRQLDSLNQHWVSFKDTFKQILNWMDSTDRTLSSHDLNLPSLQDISSRLLKYKALSQETESHKRQLDLLQSKVQSVAPLMKEEDLPLSILEATARFNNIVKVIKEHLEKMEHLSSLYQQCQDQKDVCEEWCQKNEEQLILCSDFAGNRTVLKAKEEQLRNLKEHLPEGISKIQLYGQHVQQLSDAIATRDFEQLIKSHAAFEKRYQDIATNVDETLREMTEKFKQWETFDEKCNVMTTWLENMEQRIKDFVLKTTLEEKIEQRDKFQTLVEDILANKSAIIAHSKTVESPEQALLGELRTREADFDVLSDESQELIAASGEMRISMGTSQLISRFQSMLLTCKELARKCEQHVEDHQQFNEKYKICSDWIEEAATQYAKLNVLPYNSCESLQKKLTLVQELLQTKDEGLNIMNATVQYGEQLQVGSSSDGWETAQVMLQQLQTAFDKVFDDASSLERSLLSTQFVWSEFEETLQRLQSWITNCSANFHDSPKLGINLDAKKGLLRTYKALLVDINGHDRAVEDLQLSHDCVPTLDKNTDEIINNLAEKQKSLKSKSEEYIAFYENSVQEHDAWNKAVNDIRNWLNSTQTSIDACRDTNLDRISLLGSLRTIKSVMNSFAAEKPKLASVEESFQKVLSSTHEDGKDNLLEELKSLQDLFNSTESSAKSTADLLEDLMNQWSDYEERVSEVQTWMKEIENSLQSICLKESLSEKRLQLEKLKNIQGEVREKELEIDALTDKMQQLQRGPSKRRISKLSELGISYQILVSKARDTFTKWNQYVIDHQEFLSMVAEFQKHLTDVKQKLEQCQTPEGTLEDIQEKLTIVQDIACEKESLSSTFQTITDKAQVVLTSTAPMGHSAINETIQSLQELLSTTILNAPL